jgi:hypothetical protein
LNALAWFLVAWLGFNMVLEILFWRRAVFKRRAKDRADERAPPRPPSQEGP